jgi:hypothetical protein
MVAKQQKAALMEGLHDCFSEDVARMPHIKFDFRRVCRQLEHILWGIWFPRYGGPPIWVGKIAGRLRESRQTERG